MAAAGRSLATTLCRHWLVRTVRLARRAALGLGLALAVVAGPLAAATPKAGAVGALTDAGGQVVFDFPHPVGYGVAVGANRITVTFTEPFTGSLAPVRDALPGIIGRAELSDDGTVATLYLRGAYTLRSQAVGASIVLDLVASAATRESARARTARAAASGWLEPAPAAGSRAQQAKLRTVEATYSREIGFERLIFDWHQTVPYRVEQGDGMARIEFQVPARLDLPALRAQMGGASFKVDALPGDRALVVTLALPPDAAVRHALSGGRVIVDVAKNLNAVDGDRLRHAAGGAVTVADDAAPADKDTAAAATAPEGTVGVQVTRAGDKVTSLRFDWPRTVAAGAFR